MVGASPSECDTIPGRQCMASCFFILKQFDDVLVYLKSIRLDTFAAKCYKIKVVIKQGFLNFRNNTQSILVNQNPIHDILDQNFLDPKTNNVQIHCKLKFL